MSLFTSEKFAAVSAKGTDWRDTSRAVLEQLESIRTENDGFTLGFLYITDKLADDAHSILTLFRSVTKIEHWVGSVGLGVCACGEEYVDTPAISAMIARLPAEQFKLFSTTDQDGKGLHKTLAPWLDHNDPMLVLTHGDPTGTPEPPLRLAALEQTTGGFIAGGLASSRGHHYHFSDDVQEGGLSGALFSQDIAVATTLSQGCLPMGPLHTITHSNNHIIEELDGENAFEVFSADLRAVIAEKTGQTPHTVMVKKTPDGTPVFENEDELDHLFKGGVHAAFPITGIDKQDYLVRNISGIDPDSGDIALSQKLFDGDQMLFVHRDPETVKTDLTKKLLLLRKRITTEQGNFAPQGALYISCLARYSADFEKETESEMALVKEIIGDIPLTGFYANGEISNHHLYGYASILILFL